MSVLRNVESKITQFFSIQTEFTHGQTHRRSRLETSSRPNMSIRFIFKNRAQSEGGKKVTGCVLIHAGVVNSVNVTLGRFTRGFGQSSSKNRRNSQLSTPEV
jgi:hypothetical protein